MALSRSSENDYYGDEHAVLVKNDPKPWLVRDEEVVMVEVIRFFHAGSRVFSFSCPFF